METARDFEDPSVTQLAVFLQNRVGQLRELLKTLDQAGVSVLALSVADSADFATVRLIVDRQDEARRALTADGYAVAESTALAVVLPPGRSSLLAMCRALIQAEINIHYVYPMFLAGDGGGVAVVHVDGSSTAAEALRRHGFRLMDEQDLHRS